MSHKGISVPKDSSSRTDHPRSNLSALIPQRSRNGNDGQMIDIREEQVFRSLDLDNDGHALRSDLMDVLSESGLRPDDLRIADSLKALDFYHSNTVQPGRNQEAKSIPQEIFCKAIQVNGLIRAACKGDISTIHQEFRRGADLNCTDYDLRTPLHLAAAEGSANVVKFFIDQKRNKNERINLNPCDRWGNTPLDDAVVQGHEGIIAMLKSAGCVRGNHNRPRCLKPVSVPSVSKAAQITTVQLILAASLGDMTAIRGLVARGVQLDTADYDLRTPLHLAASEGHLHVVRYFIDQRVDLNPRDRWGNTPLDDALRYRQALVAELLHRNGAVKCDSRETESAFPEKTRNRYWEAKQNSREQSSV